MIHLTRTHTFKIAAGSMLAAALLCSAPGAHAQKKSNMEKPLAGPRATALRVTPLFVTPDTKAQKVDRVQIGREMVVAEKNGPWLRVYANTDMEQEQGKDAPVFAANDGPTPVSGWMEAKGIVIETLANGDQVLMGAAANEEAEASNPRGAANAAISARLLYRRLVEMYPNSPLIAEAAWRAADDQWQLEKEDASHRSSAKERDPYMREQLEEDELKKVIKLYPKTKWADLAAFELLDNKLCGDWQGSPKCPEQESVLYEKYYATYPDSPRAPQALYQAVYRMSVLKDMYAADGSDKKAEECHRHAQDLLAKMRDKFAQSDYTWRAGTLVFKLDQNIPVYGIDME